LWKKNSELMLKISTMLENLVILGYHRSDLLFTSDYTPVLVFSSEGKNPNSERLSKHVKFCFLIACVRRDGCMEFES
jgi:hypothetical protein